ncbi:AraC family transcriptional regulator [Granulosicoccaceae sp. 1_MG-2023]|nr:AraC family transcriptional regulator [Granulosicoccaceae sp. 1_MG-2023]
MRRESNLKRAPEQELDFQRDTALGYDPEGTFGFIRCLEHGAPNPLIRWHYHDEYELHLITASQGKVFVGDYIGHFSPGHLVLTGPRLPHNWISTDLPEEGLVTRDRVVQFADEPLRRASSSIPELSELFPLLERARHGVEFFGVSEIADKLMQQIREQTGLQRLSLFLELMRHLNDHSEYRLLSGAQLQSFEDDDSLDLLNQVVDFLSANYTGSFSMAEVAEQFGMTPSRFSRYFRQGTGNTFTDFVNRLRINRACQLLMETDQYISTICYSVGFNNVANFNRRFLEVKGVTPSDFRRIGKSRFGSRAS